MSLIFLFYEHFFFNHLSLCFHSPTCAPLSLLFCISLCILVSCCSHSDFSYSSGFLPASLVAEKHTCLGQLFWVSYITGLRFWPQGWIWRGAVLKSVLPLLCVLLDRSLLPHTAELPMKYFALGLLPLHLNLFFHVHFLAFVLNVFKDANNTFLWVWVTATSMEQYNVKPFSLPNKPFRNGFNIASFFRWSRGCFI